MQRIYTTAEEYTSTAMNAYLEGSTPQRIIIENGPEWSNKRLALTPKEARKLGTLLLTLTSSVDD